MSNGIGPFQRFIQRKSLLSSFFETWGKYYLSMDEDGIHLFESKQSTEAMFTFPSRDLRSVKVELGNPTHQKAPGSGGNTMAEDHSNVIVTTKYLDEIFLRCVLENFMYYLEII